MRVAVVPEELRGLGRRMRLAQGELESLAGQMTGLLSSMQWEVRQVSRVDGYVGEARGQLGRMTGALAGMADLLERKATAFADADAAGVGELAAALGAFAARHPELHLLSEEAEVRRWMNRHLSTGNLLNPAQKSWWQRQHLGRAFSSSALWAAVKVVGGAGTIQGGWALAGWGGATVAGTWFTAVAVGALTVSGVGLIVLGAGAVVVGAAMIAHGVGTVSEGLEEVHIATGDPEDAVGLHAVNPVKEFYKVSLGDERGETVFNVVDYGLTAAAIPIGLAGAASKVGEGWKVAHEAEVFTKAGNLEGAAGMAKEVAAKSAEGVQEVVGAVRDTAADIATRFHDAAKEEEEKRRAKSGG